MSGVSRRGESPLNSKSEKQGSKRISEMANGSIHRDQLSKESVVLYESTANDVCSRSARSAPSCSRFSERDIIIGTNNRSGITLFRLTPDASRLGQPCRFPLLFFYKKKNAVSASAQFVFPHLVCTVRRLTSGDIKHESHPMRVQINKCQLANFSSALCTPRSQRSSSDTSRIIMSNHTSFVAATAADHLNLNNISTLQ